MTVKTGFISDLKDMCIQNLLNNKNYSFNTGNEVICVNILQGFSDLDQSHLNMKMFILTILWYS